MDENRPNVSSGKQRDKVEKVVTGGVRQKKKSGVSRLGGMIVPGDLDSAASYILQDVLIPTIQRALYEMVCNGLGMLLGQAPRTSKSSPNGARVSYRAYYDQKNDRRDYNSSKTRTAYSYDDVIFDRVADAEEVLWRMEELLERFDSVSVADLLDMAGLPANYTDNKYGWTDLSMARVESVMGGYRIRLPRATTL